MKAIDVMGFAGSMAAGVDQAGFDIIAKKEPAKFGGFGVASMTYNMPWVEAQVSEPEDWDLPADRDIQLVYGCPPCSGFSNLSQVNTVVHDSIYGIDAPINECMTWLIDYAALIKPPVVILESVGPAFKVGRTWMESLWERLVAKSGLPYQLTHVNMDAALVGGDVNRRRYFFVAHLQPFGVGLEFVQPRNAMDVIRDLPPEEDEDTDWGHQTLRSKWTRRWEDSIAWLHSIGLEWKPGTRFPENYPPEYRQDPPPIWIKEVPRESKRPGYRPDVYSAWYSTDPFSTFRWRGDKPFGVVVAATLGRAIHPEYPRNLTYREAARFMSLPDTWSLRWLVENHKDAELGKAVPTASAKWMAHWAKMSIEGTPGEYAGRATEIDGVRVITVNSKASLADIAKGHDDDGYWDGIASDPDPALWLVDRKQRPAEWWQREDELGLFVPKAKTTRAPRTLRDPVAPRATKSAAPAGGIVRVAPDEVQALLDELGLSKAAAAEKLGVSVARIGEMTGTHRPQSWLNAERWPAIQEVLRA